MRYERRGGCGADEIDTQARVCTAVLAAGGGAYGKWLDTTTDPTFIIPCWGLKRGLPAVQQFVGASPGAKQLRRPGAGSGWRG